jgi:hypothetical protein
MPFVVLVIDHAERLVREQVWLVSQAEQSVDVFNRPHKVVLLVEDDHEHAFAQMIKWNGGTKIRGLKL